MSRLPRKNGASEEFTFTKIYDITARQYGLVTAAVYGVVHRHCQLRDGVCRASIRRMAELIGVDKATVMRHLHKLVEEGMLEDLSPDQRHKPHIYRDIHMGRRPMPRPAESYEIDDIRAD